MKSIQQFLLGISAISILVLLYALVQENPLLSKVSAVVSALSFTIGMACIPSLKTINTLPGLSRLWWQEWFILPLLHIGERLI